jgi:glycosyltransferase involved in cell wall biosynthesis
MNSSFGTDAYEGRPRILFIGAGESTHTHAWIDLLEEAQFNLRLFVAPNMLAPPDDWKVKTYVPLYDYQAGDPETRSRLYDERKAKRLVRKYTGRFTGNTWNRDTLAAEWLAEIIRKWRPHIIHTLDIENAAYFYLDVRRQFGLGHSGKWVAQARGGPELALQRLLPESAARIREVLKQCDRLIADNQLNYQYAVELGLKPESISPLGAVPGTGGIEVDKLARESKSPPSQRRNILWPKAYDNAQLKALSVLEGLKLAWNQIQPCQVQIIACSADTRMWFHTLPEEIRNGCQVEGRVPRARLLELMPQARVMLAPSLLDGVPNSMYEAMAAGALPIVSPLETIRPLVAEEKNVLFARNLYPEEIAAALVRGMTDDRLVDAAAHCNLELVRQIANRDEIRPRVVRFYEEMAAGND